MAWYLDDDTIIGPTLEGSNAIKVIDDLAPISGHTKLNPKKTSLF